MPAPTQLLPQNWLYPTATGLYCEPGRFHIDPHRPAERAVITHGHSDHARSGHGSVLATPETIAIMRLRLGAGGVHSAQPLAYGEAVDIDGVRVQFAPAGHILGSAQIVLDWRGQRAVISGDYKRGRDPTAAAFELVACDLFVTEATFGLPLFRHPDPAAEVGKLLHSLEVFADRAHLVGVYSLGKCQRLLALIRAAGYSEPIHLDRTMLPMVDLYRSFGQDFGELAVVDQPQQSALAGAIVLVPAAGGDGRYQRALDDPVTAQASGWMRTRNRARAAGVELPLTISDHVDWPELMTTIADTGAEDIWVTHGREDAVVRAVTSMGRRAIALSLIGRGEDGE